MSATPILFPAAKFPVDDQTTASQPAVSRGPQPVRQVANRRRPTREQGIALEKLAHSIEYLVDSYLVGKGRLLKVSRTPEFEAIQILMQLNMEVFASCEEVVPFMERLTKLLHRRRNDEPIGA